MMTRAGQNQTIKVANLLVGERTQDVSACEVLGADPPAALHGLSSLLRAPQVFYLDLFVRETRVEENEVDEGFDLGVRPGTGSTRSTHPHIRYIDGRLYEGRLNPGRLPAARP